MRFFIVSSYRERIRKFVMSTEHHAAVKVAFPDANNVAYSHLAGNIKVFSVVKKDGKVLNVFCREIMG
jgi:hypothetical protein